ncbi:MAG: hypothetical protein P0116_08090 [Candidatus Nitrosocosmicus sp.]|nr:hypothetical protein [Candidatus Nitrosocosmicus sp.]
MNTRISSLLITITVLSLVQPPFIMNQNADAASSYSRKENPMRG